MAGKFREDYGDLLIDKVSQFVYFLAPLHFSAEELLLYPRRPCPRQHPKC